VAAQQDPAQLDPLRAELDADLLEYVAVTEAVPAAEEELYDPLAV
jgi:hypothetical protein